MQIIIFALCTGVATFAAVVVFVSPPAPPAQFGMLTMMALGFMVAAGVMSVVVPTAVVAAKRAESLRSPNDAEAKDSAVSSGEIPGLLGTYQTKLILGAALLEGAAFLALTAYMTEGHWASLVAAGVLFFGLLAHLPTTNRVAAWLAAEQRRIAEARQFSR
jgi:hypothetical protein